MVDNKTIQGCIGKDEPSCRIFYEQTISYVYTIVKLYVYDEEQRKDIVQETYANIFTNLQQFDPEKGEIKSWIRRITINQCGMHLRKEVRKVPVVSLGKIKQDVRREEKDLNGLTRGDVERMLVKMPAGYRTVFLLVTFDDYTHEEVSDLLGISQEASRSQLSRAKNWIRKSIFSTENSNANGTFL